MEEQEEPDEPTQETPEGYTIPVPRREDVENALRKLARRERDNPAE